MNTCIVRWVQWAPVPVEGDTNAYVGQWVKLGHHTNSGKPARMEYSPLDMICPPLESEKLPLGFAPLETAQPILGCAPLEVGQEGEFLFAASEVSKNGAIFQVLTCNCEVSSGWITADQESIFQGQTTYEKNHGPLGWLLTAHHKQPLVHPRGHTKGYFTMKNSIFVGESLLVKIVIKKFHSVGELNCLGVSRNNQLEIIVFNGNYYVPPILITKNPRNGG